MKPILLRNFLITLLISQFCRISICQVPVNTDNNRLSAGFYKDRRDALRQIMPPNSVFVLFASPERTFSTDVDYAYHQNPDMFYFSGYTEPNSMMYIFKEEQKADSIDTPFSEVIFTPAVDLAQAAWTGKIMGAEEAMKDLGIKLALEASKYEKFPVDLSKFKVIITDRLPSDVREGNSASLSGLTSAFRKKAGIQHSPDEFSLMMSNYLIDLKNDSQLREFQEEAKAYVTAQAVKLNVDPLLSRFLILLIH